MKRRPTLLFDFLAYISIYPLLILILVITGLGCSLVFNFFPQLTDITSNPTPRHTWRLVALPTPASVSTPIANLTVITDDTNAYQQEDQPQMLPSSPSDAPVIVSEVEPNISNDPENIGAPQVELQEQSSPPEEIASNAVPVQESVNATEGSNTPPVTNIYPSPTPTLALDFSVFSGNGNQSVNSATRTRRATPTPEGILNELVTSLMSAISDPVDTPAPSQRRIVLLPTLTPTPTSTSTPLPTDTPTAIPTPTETPLPTNTPIATETPLPTNTPPPTNTPLPTNTPPATPVPLPTETPPPTITPVPEYDYLLAEFFNSPTTNPFLVMYVAVVDPNEIPIGGMKIVGTRLDHNLTYESPLSTWHYEGYSAPGHVVKSGNLKFEPPGGIENISWIIHLEDASGNRLSADIPFNSNADDKQWYFVKLRRKF